MARSSNVRKVSFINEGPGIPVPAGYHGQAATSGAQLCGPNFEYAYLWSRMQPPRSQLMTAYLDKLSGKADTSPDRKLDEICSCDDDQQARDQGLSAACRQMHVLTSGVSSQPARLLQWIDSKAHATELPLSNNLTCCAFSPDGSYVLAGDKHGNVTLYPVSEPVSKWQQTPGKPPPPAAEGGAAASPQQHHSSIACCSFSTPLCPFPTRTTSTDSTTSSDAATASSIPTPSPTAASEPHTYMATGDKSGLLLIWQLQQHEQGITTFYPTHHLSEPSPVLCCTFSPTGWLAYGTKDGTIGLIPHTTWQHQQLTHVTLTTPFATAHHPRYTASSTVLCCAFDPSGQHLLTAGGRDSNGELQLWKLLQGELQLLSTIPQHHTQPINSCYFWPTSNGCDYQIVSSTAGGTTKAITVLVGIAHDAEVDVHYPVNLTRLASPAVDSEQHLAAQEAADMAREAEKQRRLHARMFNSSNTSGTSRTDTPQAVIKDGLALISSEPDGFILYTAQVHDSERDDVVCYGISSNRKLLVAGHVSGLLSVWDLEGFQLVQLVKVPLQGGDSLEQVGFLNGGCDVWSSTSSGRIHVQAVDRSLLGCFRYGLQSFCQQPIVARSQRSTQALLQVLDWHMTRGLLQEPGMLQVVLDAAAAQGNTVLLQGVLQLFASKGWSPALGPLHLQHTKLATQGSTKAANLLSLALDSGKDSCIVAIVDALLAGQFSNYSTWLHLDSALHQLSCFDYHQQLFFDLVTGMQLLDMGRVVVSRQLIESSYDERVRELSYADPNRAWRYVQPNEAPLLAAEAKLVPIKSTSGVLGPPASRSSLLALLEQKRAPAEVYGGDIPRALIAVKSQQLKLKQNIWAMSFVRLLAYLLLFFAYQLLALDSIQAEGGSGCRVPAVVLGAVLVLMSATDVWDRGYVIQPLVAGVAAAWLAAGVQLWQVVCWVVLGAWGSIEQHLPSGVCCRLRAALARKQEIPSCEASVQDGSLDGKPAAAVTADANGGQRMFQASWTPATQRVRTHHGVALASDLLMMMLFVLHLSWAPANVFRVLLALQMLLLGLASASIIKESSRLGYILTMLKQIFLELKWFAATALMIILATGIIMTTLMPTIKSNDLVPAEPSGSEDAGTAATEGQLVFYRYWLSWLQLYTLMMGGTDYELYKRIVLQPDRLIAAVGFILLVVFHLVIAIVMLNLLIAIVNEIFSRVKPMQELHKLRNRAAHLLEVDELQQRKQQREEQKQEQQQQQMYLHVIQPPARRAKVLHDQSGDRSLGQAWYEEMSGVKEQLVSLKLQVKRLEELLQQSKA